MASLIFGHSYSQLVGLTSEQFAEARKLLSYEVDPKLAYYGGFKGSNRRYLLDKKGFFPTGLVSMLSDLPWSDKLETPKLLNFAIRSPKPLKADFSGYSLYPAQREASHTAMQMSRGTLSMPTGSGKSITIAMIIDMIKVRTLIVVPNLSIKAQLINTLRSIFGSTPHIIVENIDSATIGKHSDVELLIIDEAHHVAAKTYHNLNKTAWKDIAFRYFFTATPFRNVAAEEMLFTAIAGDVIYKLSYPRAVTEGYIVPVTGSYVSIPKQSTEAHTWQQVYSQLVVNNEPRNQIIADIAMNLDAAGKSILLLVKEIKHGNILSDMTGFPFVCGEDESSKAFIEMFNNGEVKTLIGTTGVIGEGVDTRPCEYVIIAGLGKAKSSFMQQVGRSVRRFEGKESGKIILFKDSSHKFLLRHFNAQSKILKDEYNVTLDKMEV